MKHTVFTGVGTALVTPFDSRGEVLWEELHPPAPLCFPPQRQLQIR